MSQTEVRDIFPFPRPRKLSNLPSGRFYMFWNVSFPSGRPTLVALMAGDAAHQTESEPDTLLITEATTALSRIYPSHPIPSPTETIITRWKSDPYSLGSYSFVASPATDTDYDLIAQPIHKSLYFAGEASCKSHPATVHGAYISGLRVAAEIADDILGPISIPTPLIPNKPKLDQMASSSLSSYTTPSSATLTTTTSTGAQKRKHVESAISRLAELRAARLAAHEAALQSALLAALGERPQKPGRSGANPFLLYQKDHWFICKNRCDEARRQATGNQEAKATRNEVRAALGQMWREAGEEEKRPYLEETERNKEANQRGVEDYKRRLKEWDEKARGWRREWEEGNKSVPTEEEREVEREAEIEVSFFIYTLRSSIGEDGR